MEYNQVKQSFMECDDLAVLDDASKAVLFWRGIEKTFRAGDLIYTEGAKLDNTFCLWLSGDLVVEEAGKALGQISSPRIFGEMAFFSQSHPRLATIRVAWPQAAVLELRLNPEELSGQFSGLRKNLGVKAWERFVSGSQDRR